MSDYIVTFINLCRLGKKKGFPDRMVAAKFEPQENWLPPGYVIKKNNAYQGLNVIIASVKSKKRFRKQSNSEKAAKEAWKSAEEEDDNCNVDTKKCDASNASEEEIQEGKISVVEAQECKEETSTVYPKKTSSTDSKSRSSSRESTPASMDSNTSTLSEASKFERELMEATKQEEAMRNELPDEESDKTLIPYNLQTQHSLPDKSIADCVEALIGCYLTTCGQRAALLFMTWLGLKVYLLLLQLHVQCFHGCFGIVEITSVACYGCICEICIFSLFWSWRSKN